MQIPLSVPNLNLNIVENLRECIETGWVSTGGRFITEFEDKVASYVGTQSAVSTQSGTAGLHLALKALGVGPGDEVIVPTLSFIAAVNPVAYLEASPVFMDCDEFFCLDTNKLEEFLNQQCVIEADGIILNKRTNAQIKAIIAVHVFGNLCDMEHLMTVSRVYGIPVIEDATEALGTYVVTGNYKGKFAGTIGDIGVYSFNANKIITTGGGGMIVSNHPDLLEKMRYWSLTAKDDALYFVHDEVGYNYRMLNIQAALGVSQIDELETFIQIKKRNFEQYKTHLNGIDGVRLMPFQDGIRSNHWFYSLKIDDEQFGMNRDELMQYMISHGVQCRPVWKLIHTQKPYADKQQYKIEQAYSYEKNILNLPCSTNLKSKEIEYVCELIRGVSK